MMGDKKPATNKSTLQPISPRKLGADEAKKLGVAPGWWAVYADGKLAFGPFATKKATLCAIAT